MVTANSDVKPSAAARWVAAVIAILYGFAKLNGSQFTVLDSELTRPLGEVSGFWLTWHYFGYSPIYGNLLALIQIAGGILLIVPRTALMGALVLLPVATNIVLIDVFYGVDLSGTLAAGALLFCVCVIVGPHLSRLRSAVLLPALPGRPSGGSLFALVLIVLGAFALTWWGANHINRDPTPIDGAWAVASQTGGAPPGRPWTRVFFEHNRAHMAVFRAASGPDETRHFEIDQDGTIRVWEKWLTKGRLIMEGRWRSTAEIELEIKEAGGDRLVLHRIPPPQ